ncbi:RimK family alpha-L-glutamate ligase [Streptomyces sp. NPDC058471]|uniref:RimK family alpha-L-glutamate ligase n=1 Tax=Streptomyces sp. NPDC058471 TaxID=3346516 RepID=UPI0036526A63
MNRSQEPIPVLLASRVRTDEKRIMAALERRGVAYRYADSRTLWGLLGRGENAPTVVLNREIGQARAQYAATLLEQQGHQVINSARAVEVCGDKWRTSVTLEQAGLPTPRTALALTPEAALDAFEHIGYPAVVKPLTGSWGRLVTKVPDRETAETVMEYVSALPSPASHIVYVQQLVAKPDRDIRVIVIGGVPLGAVYRRSDHWRTNVARGATTQACPLTDDISKLAAAAADAVGAEIAGVDLIEDADGRLTVLEVNHGVEFSGFQAVLGQDLHVADRIADHLIARLQSCSKSL